MRQVAAFAALCLACTAHSGAVQAGRAATPDGADPMDTPAVISLLAQHSVLLDVAAAPHGPVVAVGERGNILLSTDAGVTWHQQPCPVSVTLTAIRFASATEGWAVGHSGIVLHTTDGGRRWTRQLDGAAAAVQAVADARASDAGDVARHDAVALLVKDGPDKPFLALAVVDRLHAYAAGAYGLLFGTQDGGVHWRSLMPGLPNPEGKNLYGIGVAGAAVFIAGEQGALFRSDDAGRKFVALASPYQGSYFGALADLPADLITFGLKGHAYRSSDGGRNWSAIRTGIGNSITGAARLSDGTIVMVGVGGEATCEPRGVGEFAPVTLAQAYPFTAVTQAADGAVILTGLRGIMRLPGFSCAGARS